MFDAIREACRQARLREFNESPQLSLGGLISKLENCGLTFNHGGDDQFKTVRFDFASSVPTTLQSYRGYYDELALGFKLSGYDNNDEHFAECKINELIAHCKEALGKEYTGWKGGDFIMDKNTPVWVANEGNSGDTMIIDVIDDGYQVVLVTMWKNK